MEGSFGITMQSTNLLPVLRGLPGGNTGQRMSFRDIITGLVNTDRTMYAAEFASAVSFGMWAVFPGVNVDDDLRETMTQAHDMAFGNYEGTLTEHWQEIAERGPESMGGFISILKGKAAEINFADVLEQNGYTNVEAAIDPTQPRWDISAVGLDGQEVLWQVTTGAPDHANVDGSLRETIAQAYKMTNMYDPDMTVAEHWRREMVEGDRNEQGFISNLEGKVAEINTKEQLEQQEGVAKVNFARNSEGEFDPNYPDVDLFATMSDGQVVPHQVKTGTSESQVQEILDALRSNENLHGDVSSEIHKKIAEREPNMEDRLMNIGSGDELEEEIRHNLSTMSMEEIPDYAFSTEIYHAISKSAPDTVDQLIDIGPDYALVEGTTDGLDTLSDHMGIDVPDGVVDIVPYAATIMAGARLIYSVIKTEKEFKAADRTTKNQIQVVQTLTLMSRMGITTVLAVAGGTGGGAGGSAIMPGMGTLVGGIGGSIAGAGMGMYLNKHLQPHMLNLALNITGLTYDNLFYYKNKPRIDEAALTFRKRSRELPAPSGS